MVRLHQLPYSHPTIERKQSNKEIIGVVPEKAYYYATYFSGAKFVMRDFVKYLDLFACNITELGCTVRLNFQWPRVLHMQYVSITKIQASTEYKI